MHNLKALRAALAAMVVCLISGSTWAGSVVLHTNLNDYRQKAGSSTASSPSSDFVLVESQRLTNRASTTVIDNGTAQERTLSFDQSLEGEVYRNSTTGALVFGYWSNGGGGERSSAALSGWADVNLEAWIRGMPLFVQAVEMPNVNTIAYRYQGSQTTGLWVETNATGYDRGGTATVGGVQWAVNQYTPGFPSASSTFTGVFRPVAPSVIPLPAAVWAGLAGLAGVVGLSLQKRQ